MSRSLLQRLLGGDPSESTAFIVFSGFAWGWVVTTFESLNQPPLELTATEFVSLYSRVLLHYAAGGVLLAWLTALISRPDRRFPAWIAVVPILSICMMAALTIDGLSILLVPVWRDDVMSAMWRLSDVAAHLAWIFGMYGGLYVVTFLSLRREAQTRDGLRKAELARIKAESRMEGALAERRLPVLSPVLLLRALSELARRYDEKPGGADRLLDKLVRLLRLASAHATSEVSNESPDERGIDLTASLEQLCRELEVANGKTSHRQEADHE
jgi:hypothetical protein